MPLSASQYKMLIPLEIGDDGSVAPVLDQLWQKNDGHFPTHLQYLYTKRDAIMVLKGHVWEDVDVHLLTRSGIDAGTKFDHLESLWSDVCCEIQAFVASGIEPLVNEMVAVAPQVAYPGYPDPGSGYYRGDPIAIQTYRRYPY